MIDWPPLSESELDVLRAQADDASAWQDEWRQRSSDGSVVSDWLDTASPELFLRLLATLDAARAQAAEAGGLDVEDDPWKHAENAMPPGWRLQGLQLVDTSDSEDLRDEHLEWEAEASSEFGQRSINALGPTPADALRRLAGRMAEVQDMSTKRQREAEAEAVEEYAWSIRNGVNRDWSAYNAILIDEFGLGGLVRIKRKAWALLAPRRAAASAPEAGAALRDAPPATGADDGR